VLWNTVYLGRALDALRLDSEMVPDALLAHLAPVGWQHINLTGDYLWDSDIGLAPDGFRPLRLAARRHQCIIGTQIPGISDIARTIAVVPMLLSAPARC
jgi:hypothetical protein